MARKVVKSKAVTGPSNEWSLAEILLACPTKHRNILKTTACVRHDDGSHSLFSDYCETDLRHLMEEHDPSDVYLQPKIFLSKLVDLAGALRHFHTAIEVDGDKKVLCHLDLNPENILVDGSLDSDDYQLKLTDLHVSQILGAEGDEYTRPPVNEFGVCTPPELEGEAEVNPSCDIWSLGCVLALVFVWSAGWRAGLKRFQEKRCENDRPDCFFIRENEELKVNPAVAECLQDAVDKMADDKSLAEPFQALYHLLVDDMLCIRPEDRESTKYVYNQLRKIVDMCDPSNKTESESLDPPSSRRLSPSRTAPPSERPATGTASSDHQSTEEHGPKASESEQNGIPKSDLLSQPLPKEARRGSWRDLFSSRSRGRDEGPSQKRRWSSYLEYGTNTTDKK